MARRSFFWSLVDQVLPRRQPHRLLTATGLVLLTCIVTVNLAVAFFGETLVNPISPFYMRGKLTALWRYALHRPLCFITGGHDDLRPVVTAAAQRNGLDRWLLAALVEVESGLRAHRISPTGAMGPAQLVPSTAAYLRVGDPYDPEEGIDGGARYLKEQLVRFGGNSTLAVAAYNAGPNAVVGGRVPRNGETEYYVERVIARWRATRPKPVLSKVEGPPKPPPVTKAPAPPKKRGSRR